MQSANAMKIQLTEEFVERYMEQLFYFCLKKTGNYAEAEDLTQDIAMHILAAFNKGIVPTHLSAWVWKIAYNRYAAWAAQKHQHAASVSSTDIGNYEIAEVSDSPLDKLIQTEQLALFRREMAFIKNEYRTVLVAYYMENKSIREIAASLSTSENTVKQRLYRAKIILKEGMDMAREFGRLSYNPENMTFICNGLHGENGEPWNFISRSLCKNILLAAYRTPSTAETLAMEVGVALPYMEEELAALVDATLMKKNGSKYETNFFIVSRAAQETIHAHLRGIASELTHAIIAALIFEIEWKNCHCPNWHEGYQSFEEMKWALLMKETDQTVLDMLQKCPKNNAENLPSIGPLGHTLRPNGGEWDILGLEQNKENTDSFFIGLSGCVSSPNEKDYPEISFQQYRFMCYGLDQNTPPVLTYAEGEAMVAVANGRSDTVNDILLERLASYGYIKKTDTGYIPAILVMRKAHTPAMPRDVQEQLTTLRNQACELAICHYRFCREQIVKEIPGFLKKDIYQIDHACVNIAVFREAVLEEALQQGYLSLDTAHTNKTIGAYLSI